MYIELQKAASYTLLDIRYWPGPAERREITISHFLADQGIYACKPRKGKHLVYLGAQYLQEECLVFEGHDMPFELDSETEHKVLNRCFNFITDCPEGLRNFILRYCLNPSPELFSKVLYCPSGPFVGPPFPHQFLFPECFGQQRIAFP